MFITRKFLDSLRFWRHFSSEFSGCKGAPFSRRFHSPVKAIHRFCLLKTERAMISPRSLTSRRCSCEKASVQVLNEPTSITLSCFTLLSNEEEHGPVPEVSKQEKLCKQNLACNRSGKINFANWSNSVTSAQPISIFKPNALKESINLLRISWKISKYSHIYILVNAKVDLNCRLLETLWHLLAAKLRACLRALAGQARRFNCWEDSKLQQLIT